MTHSRYSVPSVADVVVTIIIHELLAIAAVSSSLYLACPSLTHRRPTSGNPFLHLQGTFSELDSEVM